MYERSALLQSRDHSAYQQPVSRIERRLDSVGVRPQGLPLQRFLTCSASTASVSLKLALLAVRNREMAKLGRQKRTRRSSPADTSCAENDTDTSEDVPRGRDR